MLHTASCGRNLIKCFATTCLILISRFHHCYCLPIHYYLVVDTLISSKFRVFYLLCIYTTLYHLSCSINYYRYHHNLCYHHQLCYMVEKDCCYSDALMTIVAITLLMLQKMMHFPCYGNSSPFSACLAKKSSLRYKSIAAT